MSADFLFFVRFVKLPLLFFLFNFALVLLDQLFFAEFEVALDLVVAFLVFKVDLDLALFKLFFGLRLNKGVV